MFVRVRPNIPQDYTGDAEGSVVVATDSDDDGLVTVLHRGRETVYELDRVFGQSSSQAQVSLIYNSLQMICAQSFECTACDSQK